MQKFPFNLDKSLTPDSRTQIYTVHQILHLSSVNRKGREWQENIYLFRGDYPEY